MVSKLTRGLCPLRCNDWKQSPMARGQILSIHEVNLGLVITDQHCSPLVQSMDIFAQIYLVHRCYVIQSLLDCAHASAPNSLAVNALHCILHFRKRVPFLNHPSTASARICFFFFAAGLPLPPPSICLLSCSLVPELKIRRGKRRRQNMPRKTSSARRAHPSTHPPTHPSTHPPTQALQISG